MPKPIHLNKMKSAIVDDDVYEQLTQYDWFMSATGYAVGFMRTKGKFHLVYMHRFILDAGPKQLVDHINGNPLDNRRENLRFVTPQQNSQNK